MSEDTGLADPGHAEPPRTGPVLTRRALGGAALAAGAGTLVTACASDGSSGTAQLPVATDEVAVEGGAILKEDRLVVTQPESGTFKCFSAVCTHQGCLVGSVSDNRITCHCHGSVFSAEDGSVLHGPATAPLPPVPVRVKGGQVERA